MKWDEIFYYDETSPSCLRWAIDIWSGKGLTILSIKKNTPAGCIHTDHHGKQYWQVQYKRKLYMVHRVIAEIFNKEISSKVIDHIDGNSLNNSINNLRAETNKINSRNKARSKDTGLPVGIYLQDTGKNCNNRHAKYYVSTVYLDSGKKIQKKFNIGKLGQEEAMRLAIEFREDNLPDGYTERHGTVRLTKH